MKFVNPRNTPTPTTERVPYWDENRTAGLTGAIPPAKVLNDIQDEILKVITGAGFTPNADDPTQLWQALQAMIAEVIAGTAPVITVPSGLISPFAGGAAPTGWLKCNGQAVNRAGTFAALFAVIGTTYGPGDGVNTFNVPDLRGEFLRGLDDGRGIDALRALGSFQDYATAAPKTNTVQRINTDGSLSAMATYGGGVASNPSRVGFARLSKVGEKVTNTDWDSGGAGFEVDDMNVVSGDPETRPRNVAVLYIIKT